MPPKFWLPVGYVLPFMMPAPSGPENVQGSSTRPLISMGISPARAEAAAEIGFHSTNPPMCESHGFDVLNCCRLYPPSNWQAGVGVRQILRAATQAAGHQRRVRNRSPGGIAESQPNDHRSIGSQRRSFGKRDNIPATNRREACRGPRFVREPDPGQEVFQNKDSSEEFVGEPRFGQFPK